MKRITSAAALLIAIAAPAHGQPPEGLKPVDQAVADLDLLALSLRRVESGLRSTGEQSTLFSLGSLQPGGNVMPVYYRLGPGFAARVNRLDYVVRMGDKELGLNMAPRHDGEFIELIPPNTLFELSPIDTAAIHRSAGPDERTRDDAMHAMAEPLNLRLDSRVDGRVDTRLPSTHR